MVVEATDKRIKKRQAETCWNCFTVEEAEQKEPVTLTAVRKQHREKLKLYSFIATEITRPKAVPFKQRVSENFTVAKKVEKMKRDQYIQTDPDVIVFEKPAFDLQKASDILGKSVESIEEACKPVEVPVVVVNKVEIETSPKFKHYALQNRISKLKYKAVVEISNKDERFEKDNIIEEEIRDVTEIKEIDKVENESSNGSDSGYLGSMTPEGSSPIPHHTESHCDENIPPAKKLRDVSDSFKYSLPNLHKSSKPILVSPDSSLRGESMKKTPKNLRWSTLTFHKPMSLADEIYVSEHISPGHATLPRRSNSPLPHEGSLDRDRFLSRSSGLQTRSESMASVYSGAGEGARGSVTVRGDVQFSLLYNYRLGALEVGVRRCRDIAPVDVKKNRSDTYVKVYLLPDKSKTGKRKTKVKKNTLNPVFEESLTFVQPLATLSSRTLWLSVWHADMFGRNDFLGEVTLPLADVVFDDPAPKWYKLQERTEQFDEQIGTRGDVIVGLKFELLDPNRNKGTLHVLIKEAKNLVATKPNGLADVFCKSYLLPERGRLAKQKTNVVRRTLNPKWEHTFVYRGLTLQELSTRALELSLWDRDRLASNDFMGAVRLSLGTGSYMGTSVNWMDSAGKEVSLWQTMMQRPNFWVEGSLPLRPQLNN